MKNTLTVGDIKKILKEGKRFDVKNFSAFYRKTEDKQTKLSVSVQSKSVKRAVDRNYLKRLIKNICMEKINIGGMVFLVYKNKDFKNETKESVEKSVDELMEKISKV